MLRDQLLSQLNEVDSAESAALWARRIIPAKNTLNDEDARQLETAFQAKLEFLESSIDTADSRSTDTTSIDKITLSAGAHQPKSRDRVAAEAIDKSELSSRAAAYSRQGSHAVCDQTAMFSLRPHAHRSSSSTLCATSRTRPESQRSVYRAIMSNASP